MADNRTEQATPHRLRKAREEGRIPRSRELTSACAFMAGVLLLRATAGALPSRVEALLRESVESALAADWSLANGAPWVLLTRWMGCIAALVGPAMVGSAFVSAAVGVAQTRGAVSAAGLKPSLERLSPVRGLRALFSSASLMRVVRSVVPGSAMAWLGWSSIRRQMETAPPLAMGAPQRLLEEAWRLLLCTGFVMLVWGALDFVFEWRRHASSLRMTKQEVRREHRENEGDPMIKARIRRVQRRLRQRKALSEVRKASVLVTNPTHFAVALRFDIATMQPPTVLAKGADQLALRMRAAARWAGVPIVENPPLARTMYKNVPEGRAIPATLYAAVAEILAWLYRQQLSESPAPAGRAGSMERNR